MKDKKPIDNLISLDSFDEQNGDQGYNNVLNEIAQLKKTISATPTPATNTVVQDARGAIMSEESEQKLLAITEEILRCSKQMMTKFSDDIADLRGRIQKLDQSSSDSQPQTYSAPTGTEEVSAGVLRQIYSVKKLIGEPEEKQASVTAEVLSLYDMLDKVYYNVNSDDVDMAGKFESVDQLSKLLVKNASYEIMPIVDGLNACIEKLESTPLNKQRTESVIEFAQKNQAQLISSAKKEMVSAYMATVDSKIKEGGAECIDALPDVIALKNDIQHGKYEYENELKYSDILNKNIMLLGEKDIVKNKNLRAEIKEKVQALIALEVKDLFTYPPVKITARYEDKTKADGASLSRKIDELKAYVADLVLPGAITVDGAIGAGIATELELIKKEISQIGSVDDMRQAVSEFKSKCDQLLSGLDADAIGQKADNKADGQSVSLNQIVIQLDRLFDDIKITIEDSQDKIATLITEGSQGHNAAILENRDKLNEIGTALGEVREIVESESNKNANAEILQIKDTAQQLCLGQEQILTAVNKTQAEEIAKLTNEVARLTENVDGLKAIMESSVKSNAKCIAEIEKLRDQMFAVNMLEVENSEDKYDSYNNVIFDEVCLLREEFDSLSQQIYQGELNQNVLKAVENVLDNTDVIKARLQISDEARDNAVNVQNTLESKEQLSKSIEDLKSELSRLVEDITG